MTIQQSVRTTIQKMKADLLTPVTIFKRLQGRHKFLLESSTKYEESGRYSFIGVNPRKTYVGKQEKLQDILHDTDRTYCYEGPLIQTLKQVMPRVSSVTQYPFIGGAVGYIRYGAGTEQLQHDTLPEVQFHVYDTLIIFDHIADELTIAHTNIDAEHQKTDIGTILEQLRHEQQLDKSFTVDDVQIERNESVCHLQANAAGDAFELYRKLRIQLPGAYLYYLQFDDHQIIGSSMESFVAVSENKITAHAKKHNLQKVASSITGEHEITGTLQPGMHGLDALNALLPPSVITNTTIEAQKKVYGSTIGYIGFNGQIDFTLAEQVITIENDKLFVTTKEDQFEQIAQILQPFLGGV